MSDSAQSERGQHGALSVEASAVDDSASAAAAEVDLVGDAVTASLLYQSIDITTATSADEADES